jgi:hypothetical protein
MCFGFMRMESARFQAREGRELEIREERPPGQAWPFSGRACLLRGPRGEGRILGNQARRLRSKVIVPNKHATDRQPGSGID